ncbi:amino acid/amide ABC transporter ATP-binding protein 1, HAAT family [Desulfonauticus submarinus]|uniref:Amino acid/amide ABC transporter ATP-binding protein 1, HAAT family n=1 Tax=Desulfonauticus submarinus TaxID=206665 RepID=A0A1H0EMJ0_9BACT|nr:ABC transporter ATP-binding protein [Desulfonauticus submarinus]SDN83624.1 amino acid/amide ABC transporter ATP-binding protein 1, HAAT family [Desulfonauticus submarinus]
MNLLSIRNLTKSFGGLMAVNDVSFDVPAGSIVGLIGPNGAGKTTVFNLITGNYQPDRGEVLFEDRNLVGLPTHKIVEFGIARTFQTIRLFQNLSVLENVLAGCHCRMRAGMIACMFWPKWQRQEEKKALEKALEELKFVSLEKEAENKAKNLSYGNQRLLEIARALATDPKLLILDEPAGGMNEQETQALVNLIDEIKKRGITVLLIEHDMSLVMRICEKIVVLEHGAKIAEGGPEEIKSNPQVIEAYLGSDED